MEPDRAAEEGGVRAMTPHSDAGRAEMGATAHAERLAKKIGC